MNVTVTEISRREEPLLQNLMQLYVHDFGEFWAGTPKGDLRPDGRYNLYPLDEYWTNPIWSASTIECDGVLAGFALVNDFAHSGTPVDHNMAEFFIARKYRRLGVARIAAQRIFARHAGTWEVAVARNNLHAARFWRKTIHGVVGATDVTESDVSTELWNGPILRFVRPAF